MENNNFIIAEINITEDEVNEKIHIISSYENYKKEEEIKDSENDYKYENEEEIKKCKIIVDDKIIPFSYYHIFDKIGKYQIKYSFPEDLTKTSSMLYGCDSLTPIDLSNFNTQNVTSMIGMFSGCSSLTTINLSNFSIQNVNYMSAMFSGCSSLTKIDLSYSKCY